MADGAVQSLRYTAEENLKLTRDYVTQLQEQRQQHYNQSWRQICCSCVAGAEDSDDEVPPRPDA